MPPVDDLAGGGPIGSHEPELLFARDIPIHTDTAPTAVANVIKYELLYLDTNNTVRRVDPALDKGDRCVVAAQPVVNIGDDCPYYDGGGFNHEIIVWPAALDTFAKRKSFLAGGNVQVGKLPFNV